MYIRCFSTDGLNCYNYKSLIVTMETWVANFNNNFYFRWDIERLNLAACITVRFFLSLSEREENSCSILSFSRARIPE